MAWQGGSLLECHGPDLDQCGGFRGPAKKHKKAHEERFGSGTTITLVDTPRDLLAVINRPND